MLNQTIIISDILTQNGLIEQWHLCSFRRNKSEMLEILKKIGLNDIEAESTTISYLNNASIKDNKFQFESNLFKFATACGSMDKIDLYGFDLWKSTWIRTGERVIVRDPLHHQYFNFDVYVFKEDENKIKFAAGEFSNSIFGIFATK